MNSLLEKFSKLGVANAPGQESRQKINNMELRGEKFAGTPVDFSHGDIDAHPPIPGSLDKFVEGFHVGGIQAYTEYRGKHDIREELAEKLSNFTGAPIDAEKELILAPGTQGALFLAAGANIGRGDKVAIIEPDYFANRKMVEFFDGELVPIPMDYFGTESGCGIDLGRLEESFKSGVKLSLFSNPNNPTGAVYSREEIISIATLAERYHVDVIVDQLYSRQIFSDCTFTHLRSRPEMNPENLLTIIGPSKTESLSGFRLGVGFGSSRMIDRMEKLQAIVSLRAAGYCQAVLRQWFSEPTGWMEQRVADHEAIRNDIHGIFSTADGYKLRLAEGGSYLFPKIPELTISLADFTKAVRLQADVIVTRGTEFGSGFSDSFRINFSQDHQAAVDAIHRTIEIANRYRV